MRDTGMFDAINMALVMSLREIEAREASLSVGVVVVDRQLMKTTESGARASRDCAISSLMAAMPSRN